MDQNCHITYLATNTTESCEIMKSLLTCHNPIHPKHKTLSLNDLFALNWPNYHVTLFKYPRCFQHTIPTYLATNTTRKLSKCFLAWILRILAHALTDALFNIKLHFSLPEVVLLKWLRLSSCRLSLVSRVRLHHVTCSRLMSSDFFSIVVGMRTSIWTT